MLETQRYLQTKTLDDLKQDYAISSWIQPELGVVTLNYNQIMSPMEEPIVQECRALTLALADWRVVSWPLARFFNWGQSQVPSEFNYSRFKVYEKLDGSLIHFYHLPQHGWVCGTRSVPDANTRMDDTQLTFRRLVEQTITEMGFTWDSFVSQLNPACCYGYELTAPENRVVVDYPDRHLTLLTVRDLSTLDEIPVEEWAQQTGYVGPVVPYYGIFSDIAALHADAQKRDPLKHEGFVLVDEAFHRIKLKAEAYFFMSSRRDSLTKSNRARIELILADAADDVLPTLSAHQQGKILELQARLQEVVHQVEALWEAHKGIPDDKEFALAVVPTGLHGPLFALRRGRVETVLDFFKQTSSRNVLGYLKVDAEDE